MTDTPRHTDVEVVRRLDKKPGIDAVTIEEPLEIWVAYPDADDELVELSLSITMRTPGHDEALAVGFLFSEGIIRDLTDIIDVRLTGPVTEPLHIQNQIKVTLVSGKMIVEKKFQRYFFSNSACGVCGKASIQALEMLHEPEIAMNTFSIDDKTLRALPQKLRQSQSEFQHTGGLHAVALVDSNGALIQLMEDIGRHNAIDKLLGQLLIDNRLEVNDKMLLVSGRASYELLQKSLMADIPFFASIGAPSSAAVDLASNFGVTLVGFLNDKDYNIYSQSHRVTN
jgi:FdhD protein